MVKLLPNVLTFLRLVLAVFLFFFEPFSTAFVAIYAAAVLTDVVDGPLARRLNAISKFGANLDTFADMALVAIMLLRIVPVLNFSALSLVIIASIFAVKGLALLVSYTKYKQVVSM